MIKDLSIKIETPSQQLFENQYPQLVKLLKDNPVDLTYQRDGVTFGPGEDLLIVGLVFIYQSVLSGITWDVIRQILEKIVSTLNHDQKQKIYVYFENKQTKERVKISITDKNVDMIEIKDKLKIKFK